MEKYNLDIASEFLVMASTLIYLKSKRLLPKLEPEEVEEITEEELARRILEYKIYKDFSNELKERYEIYSKRFFKEADKIELPKKKIDKEYDKLIIPNTYYNLVKRNENLKNINYENVNKLAEYEKVTVRSKARDILKQLMRKPKFVFNKIFAIGKVTKLEKVTAFLSLLELAKIKRISINQNETFGDITIEKINKIK